MDAATIGDLKRVEWILRDGMPVDVSYMYNWTALHIATRYGQNHVIKHLLHEGADVNRQDGHKATALHYATYYNNTEAVRLLIDN